MIITLHQYQQELKEKIYNEWARVPNVLAVLPTGGGKSIVVSDIILDGAKAGMQQCVIAHRNELVSQMSGHIARRGIPHRIIGSDTTIAMIRRQHRNEFGQVFVNPTARTAVVGVDTLIARRDNLAAWATQTNRWVIDECFIAGTLIETVQGEKPIEKLQIGDEVLAFNDVSDEFSYKKITRLFKNKMPDYMMRLTYSGHHVIVCTGNHPFWTRDGWVEAKNLTEGQEIYYVEKNSTNRSKMFDVFVFGIFERKLPERTILKTWACLLFKKMFDYLSFSNFIGNNGSNEQKVRFGKNENKKPNENTRNPRQSFKHFANDEAQTKNSGRERETVARSRKKIIGTFHSLWFSTAMRCENKNAERFGLSFLLQTRRWITFFQDWYRGGRKFTLRYFEKKTRHEERHFSKWVRLDGVEIQKSANNGKSSRDFVYNFEVDELHTYVANKIVVHNCHHLTLKNKWGKAVQMFPHAQGLGVTATPCRADGQGLGREFDGVMDSMVLGPTMRQLIDWGNLCDYEIVCPESDIIISDDNITASGDYSPQKLAAAAEKSHIVGDVVENYIKYASGRRAIVFATDVKTAHKIAEKFNVNNIAAAAVSAQTPVLVREKYTSEFKAGKLLVLVNVDLFDEGYDCPNCDVVIMARQTASLCKYMQMIGRALRYVPGKVALIIDHVSNVKRHKLPDIYRQWSLARRDKRAKKEPDPNDIPLTVCKSCARPYERVYSACPHCGAVPPLPNPQERTVEVVDGDLLLLDRAMLEQMRRATELEAPADIGARVRGAAGKIAAKAIINKQIEKIEAQRKLADEIAQWAAIQREMGRSDSESYRRFYLATGTDVLSMLNADRTREEYEESAAMIRGWYAK